MTAAAARLYSSRTDVLNRIQDIIESGELDPYTIVNQVVTTLPDSEIRLALEWALLDSVRTVRHSIRSTLAARARALRETQALTEEREFGPEWVAEVTRFLHRSEYVDKSYKRLGDCTKADLEWLRDYRYIQANGLAAEAERYEMLRKAMGRLKTVSQVPAEKLGYIMALSTDELTGLQPRPMEQP